MKTHYYIVFYHFNNS